MNTGLLICMMSGFTLLLVALIGFGHHLILGELAKIREALKEKQDKS